MNIYWKLLVPAWVSLMNPTLMRLIAQCSKPRNGSKDGNLKLIHCRVNAGLQSSPRGRHLFFCRVWLVLWDTGTQTSDSSVPFRLYIFSFDLCTCGLMLIYEIMQQYLSLVFGIQGFFTKRKTCAPYLSKATAETKVFNILPTPQEMLVVL